MGNQLRLPGLVKVVKGPDGYRKSGVFAGVPPERADRGLLYSRGND